MEAPEPFLEIRVHELELAPTVSGLCVGYEMSEWRALQFADHLIEWLPEFALNHAEILGIHSGNMVALIREAAKKIYETDKFSNRGEFGEVILHAAIRQVFNSEPAISKIFYKSALNDPVKGFDAVHVVHVDDGLELWLGEAKFYKNLNSAIHEVVKEIQAHTNRDYLKDEFILISGKIDSNWKNAGSLKKLISPNASLDMVFKKLRFPILLTYDSNCVSNHNICSAEYCQEFSDEIINNYQKFCSKDIPENISVHLFLLPLRSKEELSEILDNKLKGWQTI